jgi:tetratricopeptide (TPR) repeat protein
VTRTLQNHASAAIGAGEALVVTFDQALAMAYAHWNAGQTDQAEQLCQQILHHWPENADALHLLGLLAYTHGNLPVAIDFLRRACATPKASAQFYANLAEICRQNGQLSEAEEAGRRALALDPELSAGWINLGITLQEIGRLDESLICLRQAVQENPDSAENQNNLANTLKRMGRLEEAARHYRTALKLNPSYSEAHSNLADLLNDLGETTMAMEEVRRAIDHNPRNANAYINGAAISLNLGQANEALQWADGLLTFSPGHSGGLIARTRALRDAERLDEALQSIRLAISAAPENGEAQVLCGEILGAMGRTKEAFAAFDKATALPASQPVDALTGKATLLLEMGRQEEALEVLDKALDLYPRSAGVWFSRSISKTFSVDDPDIERMENLLGVGGLQIRNDRIMLHFALGKAWMDAGNTDRAFAQLNSGNRLKRSSFTYDAEEAGLWIASIIEHCSPELMARLSGMGDPSDKSVFVIGMPRSGTTLVEQILASHPDIYGAGELRTVQGMVDCISGADLHPIGYPKLLGSLLPHDLPNLGRVYREEVSALAPGYRRIVDKMPANFLYVGLLHLMMPNATFINCRRDPVDTCLSCYARLFSGEQKFAYDLREVGLFHRAYDQLMAHWRDVISPSRLTEVHYEALTVDLEGEARRLISFLGLDWSDRCLDFHRTERQIRTSSLAQVRQPIYQSSVGRWKAYVRHLAPLLDALGLQAEAG